ncbi:MAG TPA: hypothetical protein VEQ11_20650 [Chloroflexota bacterium]|nr:hypothetical protein [Chloroflexota bacterium]
MVAQPEEGQQDIKRRYDELYDRYGKPLDAEHRGAFVAISTVGASRIGAEARLDAGFDGDVVCPSNLVQGSQLADGHVRWTLADGSDILAAYYLGTVQVAP